MIIYFDFKKLQTQFIKQQNESNSFAVDFLIDKAQKKDFVGIINDALTNNKELLNALKTEKNFVVLPDCVVGFDNLEVPTENFWSKNKYFDTKFNLLYNAKNNLIVSKSVYSKDHNKTTYLFATTKKQIVEQIVDTFKRHDVVITGISYFSLVLNECLTLEKKQFSKTNLLVILNQGGVNLFGYSNGFTLGTKDLNILKNKENFAKKYAILAKNKQNSAVFLNENIENEIKNTKLEKSDFDIKFPKLQWAIEEFEKTFTESNLKLNFDKICVINSNDKFVDLDNPKIIAIENFDLSSALKAYKSSPFYIQKRRFWK